MINHLTNIGICFNTLSYLVKKAFLMRIAAELSDIRELSVINYQLTDESMVYFAQ